MKKVRAFGLVAAALALAAGAVFLFERQAAPAAEEVAADASYGVLQRQLERNPRDVRVRVLKARADSQAGRHDLAVAGFRRALNDSPKVARDPGVWVELAEALALQQGGKLAGEPRGLLDKALAMNPDHPGALDLAGTAAWEAGDFAAAQQHWQRLLSRLQPDDPRRDALERALAEAQRRARFALPPAR